MPAGITARVFALAFAAAPLHVLASTHHADTTPATAAGASAGPAWSEERDLLGGARWWVAESHAAPLRTAAGRPLQPRPLAVRARIVEAWRPNRLLNVLIVALPGPGAPFVTQGGAAVEFDVVDVALEMPVVGLRCRRYAGVLQFLDAFGRLGHAKAALQDCAKMLVATPRDSRPPAALLARPNDEPGGTMQQDRRVVPNRRAAYASGPSRAAAP